VTDSPGAVKKILLALESGKREPFNLDVTVDFALRFKAEVTGLFVEDTDLLRLSALPFSTQVNLTTALSHPLERGDLERDFAVMAAAARRRLSDAAARREVKWSFKTVRGRAMTEIVAAAADADLLVMEGGRPGARRYESLGMSPGAALAHVSQSLLILRADRPFTRAVAVVYDGRPLSRKALSAAAAFMQPEDKLTVLLCAGRDKNERVLTEEARAILGLAAGVASFEPANLLSIPSLCLQMRLRDPGLIVMGADNPLLANGPVLPDGDVHGLLDTLECPLWVVP
jgi:nucleotide-binding universal stress UspA family protein